MKESLTLFSAIIIGILFPQLSYFSFIIQYLLGIMLFFSFLKAKISFHIFTEKKIYFILLANILIGWAAYFFLLFLGFPELAFIGFVVGMIPTAMASPAVISVLKGNVSFVLGAVIVTNFGIGFLFPFFSSFISPIQVSTFSMLINIFTLLSLPFILSFIAKKYFHHITRKILQFSHLVFFLWAIIIILALSKSSNFLQNNWHEYSSYILPIAIISAVLCIINFTIGHYIGGKKFSKEASQSLGQKNPMLMIWISLTFFSPLVALGPTFYIIFHNIVNAWKLMKNNKNISLDKI